MASFDRNSNFNAEANFTGVKFGEAKPVLETELNELQEIQNEARAEIIRDSIPSGFVQLGELDYDYMLNNENCVKLKSDSVAYVNGYKIKIPKDTIINIGKAPEKDAREDLVFLEVWKEEVNKDTILTKNGGEGQAQITNAIKDDRYPVETSRRYALKWRLRHVANVDFIKYYMDGFSQGTLSRNFSVTARGGADVPYTPTFETDASGSFNRGDLLGFNDIGLYVTSKKDYFKTLDGYVYAIPMFRLYRKPSCGKAIPFEYRKIHPKVDYTKFTSLMKEEKVERVVNEIIGGRSLYNYGTPTIVTGAGSASGTTITSIQNGYKFQKSNTNLFHPKFVLNKLIKPNTVYTVLYDIKTSLTRDLGFCIAYGDAYLDKSNSTSTVLYNNKLVSGTSASIKQVVTTQSAVEGTNTVISMGFDKLEGATDWCEITNLMVLEGDWTNKPIPKFFTGLKSLSEDEGNLVEVKTGILNESSYDPSTGTPKLNTVSGANYVASDNLIIPNIEAQVKRGDNKLSDLTSFKKVDNLVGDEKIEFTKLKGRTIQNLCTGYKSKGNDTVSVTSTDVTITNPTVAVAVNFKALLKPSTTYTLLFRIINKTLSQSLCVDLFPDTLQELGSYDSMGIYKKVFTTESDITSFDSLRYYVRSSETGMVRLSYPVILEGDYTNVAIDQTQLLKLIGMKSCFEDENNKLILKTSSVNLFNHELPIQTPNIITRNGTEFRTTDQWGKISDIILKNNTTYTFSCEVKTESGEVAWYDSSALIRLDYNYGNPNGSNILIGNEGVTINGSYRKVKFSVTTNFGLPLCPFSLLVRNTLGKVLNIRNIELVEGNSELNCGKYKEYRQEITLKEPLRSLPNGVCDTIESNKVIRRVGKIILNGSEDWDFPSAWGGSESDSMAFALNGIKNMFLRYDERAILCDKLLCVEWGSLYSSNNKGISVYTDKTTRSDINIRILRSALVSQDIQGLKTWLSQNPTTVYYELANPIEETIEPNYDKETIKTYQLDAPLRSLPNGIKDEIIGNKLIRRCGEVYVHNLITSSNMAVPSTQTDLDRLFCYIGFTQCKKSSKINIISDRLPNKSYPVTSDTDADTTTVEYISTYNGADVSNWLYIKVLKTKLESLNRAGFEKWLIENPIKIIYELANPIEIPLKEVHSNTANFTLQRQFSSGNYLRELPNGVKDTVENGKVIRRVGKITFKGTGTWSVYRELQNTIAFSTSGLGGVKSNSSVLNSFGFANNQSLADDIENVGMLGSNITIRILKSRLQGKTPEAFLEWTGKNPITVLYELATPTEKALSTDNYMPYPCHEINTYCGSLYVGNGTNDAFVNNGLKNDSVVIDTNFRSIENKAIVTDCRYKKSIDGYDTMYQNLFNGSYVRGNFDSNTGQEITHATNNRSDYIKVTPKTNYTIIYNLTKLGVRVVCYTNDKQIIRVINNVMGDFTTPDNCVFIRFTCDGVNIDWSQILLTLGSNILPFKNFNTGMSCFENTEANDVEDLRHLVSLTGFNYEQILNESFDKLLKGEL